MTRSSIAILFISLFLVAFGGRHVCALPQADPVTEWDADFVLRVAPSPSPSASTGILVNETSAASLNYSQYAFTLVNSLYHVNPKLCLNQVLTIGAANVVDNMVQCTVEEVTANNCSEIVPHEIGKSLFSAGWTSPNVTGFAMAVKLPAKYFNWTSPAGESGMGLTGKKGFEAATLAVPKVVAALRSTLEAKEYNFVGAYSVPLLDDQVYTYVVLGQDPAQMCYSVAHGAIRNNVTL